MTKNYTTKFLDFFKLPFFTNRKYIISIWLVVTVVSVYKQYFIDRFNNYKIFRQVFYHLMDKLPLYKEYPNEYFDHNHYGPIFGLIIAPFALLPDYIGLPLWGLFNAGVLIFAITKLPLQSQQITAILWICFHEFLTTLLGVQFNPLMTAIIILSFVYIQEEKDFWSAFCIILGTFVKLYGIVGLAFFFFSKHKIKFILSLVFWSVLLFLLPMVLSSPDYIIHTYQEWYYDILDKNIENTTSDFQDISVMGMVRRILGDSTISNIPFLIGGVVLFASQYLRINQYSKLGYRLLLLASTLIFTVIFSSGSESPTYIIAFVGVAIWFVIQPRPFSGFKIFLFVFAIVLTSLSPSDLIPAFIKENYVKPYSLKALPCILIWFVIVYELLANDFSKYQSKNIVHE